MRDKMVAIELTEKEMLISSMSMYLASKVLKDPHSMKDDPKALECVVFLLSNMEEWKEYCEKMHDVCVKAITKDNL